MILSIDGRPVSFEGRPSLLEIAKANNIFVPSLCDHPALEPYAACRLCLVEIEGRKGYVPACSTIAEDGLVVRTATPDLMALRRGILELILAEHPHACLICSEKKFCDDYKSTIRKTDEVAGCVLCPANSRCELQRVVQAVGLDTVPYPAKRREGQVRRDDPFIDRDNSLCILCGRCVRICRDVRGADVLTFVARGSSTVVGTALDRRLLDAGCRFCGACVDVCPTGALMERAARYTPPPDAEAKLVCPLCAQGCALNVQLREGRILSSAPDPQGRVNRGQACVRGRFLVRPAVDHPRRLRTPLIRENGALREADWDEALSLAAARLAGFGPGQATVAASGQSSCEDLFALYAFAADVLKAPAVIGSWEGSAAASLRELVRSAGRVAPLNFRISHIGAAGAVIVLDEDLPATHPIVGLAVHKAGQRGGRIVRVDRSKEPQAPVGVGDWTIPMGKEALFLTTLSALVADRAGAGSRDPRGFKTLKTRLDAVDTGRAARELGIPLKDLREIAGLLSRSAPSYFLFGRGFAGPNKGPGALAVLWNLALLVGGRLVPLDAEANARGGLEIAEAFAARVSRPEGQVGGPAAGGRRAFYVAGSPIPADREKADIVILQTSYLPENPEDVEIILPETTSFEAEGTLVNIEGMIQTSAPAVEPLGRAKPGWWIIGSLAAKLGFSDLSFKSAEEIRSKLAASVPGFGDLTAGARPDADVFLREAAGEAEVFISEKHPAGRGAPGPVGVPRNPDDYKGLDLAREHKSLRLVRERR